MTAVPVQNWMEPPLLVCEDMKFLQVFETSLISGGNTFLKTFFWFSWVFWVYFTFQTISSKKKISIFFHPTDRKISASIYLIFSRILKLFTTYQTDSFDPSQIHFVYLKLFTTYRTDRKIACTSVRLGSKPWPLFAKPRPGACKAVYHPYSQPIC